MHGRNLLRNFMAKFANPSKLSKEEQEKLLIHFCQALSKLNSPIEAAKFIKDLLSSQEAEMLARRLKVAEMLFAGMTYSQIAQTLKIGGSTIARVHEWIKISGDGFRLVLERVPKEDKAKEHFEDKFNPFSWRNVKRRYPLYFWPQLLLEEVIKVAKENEIRKLRSILKKMDKKSALYKRLSQLLFSQKGQET